MKLKIEWTEQLVKDLVGSLVSVDNEICILAYMVGAAPGGNCIYLVSSRDGMLYTFGLDYAAAAKKLNDREVLLFHQKARVSISGELL